MSESNDVQKKERVKTARFTQAQPLKTMLLIGFAFLSISFLVSKADSSKDPKPSTSASVQSNLTWPPKLNSKYPDLELMSSSGKKVKLSSFAGKIILLEPIGMSCPACQAFVGAEEKGVFQGGSSQPGLPSIDTMLKQNGIAANDSRLARVQLILYSPSLSAPSLDQAKEWAKHFGFGEAKNELILIGDQSYINSASYNMIPGFQLIDKDFVLRCDATGHNPTNDLYKELLPMLKQSLQ